MEKIKIGKYTFLKIEKYKWVQIDPDIKKDFWLLNVKSRKINEKYK